MLHNSNLSELCYAYKIRSKPEDKLVEKVGRKRKKKPDYDLFSITDVVGLRLVALFRAEMIELFDKILSAIMHTNGINPNPFNPMDPEEVIIYKGANAFDELAPRLKEVAARHCPSLIVKEENSPEGYSSVHLVTRLKHEPSARIRPSYKLPIEIQIRSVFEDAWGEIDHKYGYVIRSGKDIGKPINNPEFVLSHLKVLKRFTDACMEYSDAIRTEAIGIPAKLLAVRKVIPVPSDKFILVRFRNLGLDPLFIEKFEQAREARETASAALDGNQIEARTLYIDAAELFRELADRVVAENAPSPSSTEIKLAYYYSRMNEAICLLSTNERDQVVVAHRLYQSLDSQYTDYPLLKMRYGQALGKLGHLDEAIGRLREAKILAEEISKSFQGKEGSEWPDNLPLTDYEHISRTQPKLLGYHLWLKIGSLGKSSQDEKYSLFKEAYSVTLAGLPMVKDDSKLELSLHNNLLYFALGQKSRLSNQIKQEGVGEELNRAISEHLSYIENSTTEFSKLLVSQLDTLMKAYHFLERLDEAKKIARILLEKCLSEPNVELHPQDTLEFVGLAYHVMEGREIGPID